MQFSAALKSPFGARFHSPGFAGFPGKRSGILCARSPCRGGQANALPVQEEWTEDIAEREMVVFCCSGSSHT